MFYLLLLNILLLANANNPGSNNDKKGVENVVSEKESVSNEDYKNEHYVDEDDKEDTNQPIEINTLKVVQDNISGNKHSSFSEDKSRNRGDEETVTDIKKTAEKKLEEKGKLQDNKEVIEEDIVNDAETITDTNSKTNDIKVDKPPDETNVKPETQNENKESEPIEAELLLPKSESDPKEEINQQPSLSNDDSSSVNKNTEEESNEVIKNEEKNNDSPSPVKEDLNTPEIPDIPLTDLEEGKQVTSDTKEEDSLPTETLTQDVDSENNLKKTDHSETTPGNPTHSDDKQDISSDNIEKTTDTLSNEMEENLKNNDQETIAKESEEVIEKKTSSETDKKVEAVIKEEEKQNSEPKTSTKKVVITEEDIIYKNAQEYLTKEKKDLKKAYKMFATAAEKNHTKSMEEIAYPTLFGDYGLKRSLTKAVQIFQHLAEKGSPVGQQGLGFIYGAGLNVNSSQAKSLIYTTFSALGGDTMGQMMLGYRYLNGIGVTQSCEAALTYYKKVAKKVSDEASPYGGNAIQRIRLYDELEQPGGTAGQIDEDLLQYYQFLADKGDLSAQIGLGQLYFQGGRGVDVNYEKAFKYFSLVGAEGNGNGLAYLGKMYMEGLFVTKDIKKAYEHFKKAAELKNPIAQAGLGMMYLKGIGVKKDYDAAMKYFSQAAEQGWVEGQLQLGQMYYSGIGVKKDYRQAVKYFTFASQSGHVLAFYNLATMHATGAGVMRSCNTATELFKNVAERGKWSMIFMDAHDSYKSGDIETALFKYYFLGELGYEIAQSNVAYILDKGDVDMFSPNQTYARALLQWTRAAHQGYAIARVKVGDYHYYGLGTKVDYEAAALHYRLASDQQSNPQAMFNLGYMHEQGFGLKKDIHLAKRFYDLAAEASLDAQFPVYIALTKLTFYFLLEWLQLLAEGVFLVTRYRKKVLSKGVNDNIQNYRFWEKIDIDSFTAHVYKTLGPEWDVYIMSALAGLLVILLLFRRAMRL